MFSMKEIYHYTPMKEKTNTLLQQGDEDDDQAEETLSLCDLPIYSHNSSDFSNTISSNDFSSESFEFFRTDFASQSPSKIDPIIFCGKPIPSNQTPKCKAMNTSQKNGNMSIFSGKIKRISSCNSKSKVEGSLANGSSEKKMSKLKYWCLLMFGLQRFSVPTKMELADIKYRQSRTSPKSMEMLTRSCSGSNDEGLSYLIRSLSCKSNNSLNVLD